MSRFLRASCALSAKTAILAAILPSIAAAQTALPTITVTSPANPSNGPVAPSEGSLTIPTVAEARKEIQQTPGAVAIVTSEELRDQRTATVKDMFDYVPGVWAQPKWGEDARLSIRGSGLSRNFHGRGIQLYMDGIPINTADGYFDLQEIDPTAYRYTEVFRGANALRFGANALGGAINFVVPSGRDASPLAASQDIGAFGYRRIQASSGAAYGPFDYFVTGSYQMQDGYRDHSNGDLLRGSANFGYRISPNVETRFYFNGNNIEQRIPGSVTKASALNAPRTAALNNVLNDWQRNINSNRVANKTTIQLDNTTFEVGAFSTSRHLMHPIFQWLDYDYEDYGGFGRMVDDRLIHGFRNRLVAGVNILNGEIDNKQYQNGVMATKGALLSSSLDKSKNTSAYVENSFYFLPNVAAVAGTQFLNASRQRIDRFLSNGDQSGKTDFNLWSPKFGLLWDIDPTAQVFANISRSAEVPSFGEGSSALAIPFTQIQAQRATTYEIGTRGRRPYVTWDIALYRAEIQNELLCFSNQAATGSCDVLNAGRTVHQGLEVGFGAALVKSMFVMGDNPDTLWAHVAYTWNDFFYDNDPTWGDNALPGAPPHYLRAELVYKHPSGIFFGPNIEWVPQGYYVDAANTLTTDPYALWGLRAGYDKGERLSFYVEGRNLSNKAYIASASTARVANLSSALFEPGTGRAVYAGLKFKW
ncbi:TonB-dependent receptor family protein [Pseudorhodoplanes sinuspersici]|uniref:Ligand-gated channel protein n=1 Tax=Pseudorhodoplanes sinuspersici TaxID=1235591 RepID=A0A1W6ZNG3_9HYPH|nr:TonB-dependent receptor [Pseudorhodoplanes sinuspersici]ARP98901.1 ligand-gated channel protein [Pseudorhodoplanes sinuspersici]RKE69472.1 iron complex outermembrane receptor protein [Pseudorhodoplanes sinuspersici]